MAKIIVHDTGVTVISVNNEDFISLTDIARYKITLSPKKWIDTTNAIGLIAKSGRYGGTYAHKDIAFKFASHLGIMAGSIWSDNKKRSVISQPHSAQT